VIVKLGIHAKHNDFITIKMKWTVSTPSVSSGTRMVPLGRGDNNLPLGNWISAFCCQKSRNIKGAPMPHSFQSR